VLFDFLNLGFDEIQKLRKSHNYRILLLQVDIALLGFLETIIRNKLKLPKTLPQKRLKSHRMLLHKVIYNRDLLLKVRVLDVYEVYKFGAFLGAQFCDVLEVGVLLLDVY